MIQLWYSNYLERLVDAFVACAFARDSDPLDTRLVVVPNRNIETYLKLEVARREGISANVEYMFLNRFLTRLLGAEIKFLDREMVRGLLLDEILSTERPLPELDFYLDAARDHDDRDRRAFQVADRLARFFEEYELSRPQMIEAWATHTILEEEPFKSTEAWQRELWLRIFGPEGKVEEIRQAHSSVQVMRLGEFLSKVANGAPPLGQPIHFFGLSYLAKQYYRVIEGLSSENLVYLYTLNPCMEFWEDLPSEWKVRRAQRFQKRARSMPMLNLRNEANIRVGEEEDPIPLRLWGEPGRDHIRFLNQLTECDFEPLFEDPMDSGDSLLHQIQHDIYARNAVQTIQRRPWDPSFVVLECPTLEREVEIVASEIWRVIQEEEEKGNTLNFNDFAVVVNPEDREAYQAHIRAIFRDTWNIPHNIIDISASKNRRFLEGVDLLLKLPFGEFRRDELLRLLTHPNVMARAPEARPQDWKRWVDDLHILYGGDQSDLEHTYIKKALYHWDQGLRRLSLGVLMHNDTEDLRVFSGEQEWVPYSTSPSEMKSVASFVRAARELISKSREFAEAEHPLKVWYTLVAEWIRASLHCVDEDDEMDMSRVLRTIDDLEDRELSTRPVSYRVALDSIDAALENLEISRGQYLAEGVVVSSFVPMRPIPFKVVFILGLGERNFPRMDTRSPLDLRWARSEEFDHFSSRRNDEYMFLETMISTRERLYLSYVSRNSHTGEEMMPSSVVRELDFMLKRYYLNEDEFEKVHRKHPLRRFDPAYFRGDPKFINVHPEALREAKTLALRSAGAARNAPEVAELLGFVDLPERPEWREEVTISIRQIRRFLENPLQGTAEFFLGLRSGSDEDIFAVETEHFSTPGAWVRRELSAILLEAWTRQGADLKEADLENLFDEHARVQELCGQIPTGIFLKANRQKHLRKMQQWLNNLEILEISTAEKPEVWHFGRDRERRVKVNFSDPVEFQVPGEPPLKVILSGKTGPVLPKSGVSLTLNNASGLGSWNSEYQFLSGFLDYMVLLATGRVEAERWRVVVNGNDIATTSNVREFVFRDADEARDEALNWLHGIFRSMVSGVHTYQFPADAALDQGLRSGKWAKPFDRIVRNSKLNWGPIKDPKDQRLYRIPSDDEVADLIEARLGPYFKSRQDPDAW